MSHSEGNVTFQDGEVFYFEYNGTCDIAVPKLYKTVEEMRNNWRRGSKDTCECEGEEVKIYTTYGRGIEWMGKACKDHMCITAGRDPFEEKDFEDPPYPFGRF